MENKKLYIALGVLALAGVGFYFWKKNKDEESETETKSEKKNNVGGNTIAEQGKVVIGKAVFD